jgi:hypothetical protein
MSDVGNAAAEYEDLKADIARMGERLAQLEERDHAGETALRPHPATPFVGPELTVSDTTETVAQPVSRRDALLALGGVAASGVGLAVGSTLIGAVPAAAALPPGKSVFLLPTPIRVLDTREAGSPAVPDRPGGPVPANSGVVVTIGGVTVNGLTIPPNATGVIGNATAAAPSADGFLTLYAAAENSSSGRLQPQLPVRRYGAGEFLRGPDERGRDHHLHDGHDPRRLRRDGVRAVTITGGTSLTLSFRSPSLRSG